MSPRSAGKLTRPDGQSDRRPHAAHKTRAIAHHEHLLLVTQNVVDAALAWADRDYGDLGELEADAALNDAVRQFKHTAEHLDGPLMDLLFHPRPD